MLSIMYYTVNMLGWHWLCIDSRKRRGSQLKEALISCTRNFILLCNLRLYKNLAHRLVRRQLLNNWWASKVFPRELEVTPLLVWTTIVWIFEALHQCSEYIRGFLPCADMLRCLRHCDLILSRIRISYSRPGVRKKTSYHTLILRILIKSKYSHFPVSLGDLESNNMSKDLASLSCALMLITNMHCEHPKLSWVGVSSASYTVIYIYYR